MFQSPPTTIWHFLMNTSVVFWFESSLAVVGKYRWGWFSGFPISAEHHIYRGGILKSRIRKNQWQVWCDMFKRLFWRFPVWPTSWTLAELAENSPSRLVVCIYLATSFLLSYCVCIYVLLLHDSKGWVSRLWSCKLPGEQPGDSIRRAKGLQRFELYIQILRRSVPSALRCQINPTHVS